MAKLRDITSALDAELRIADFTDDSHNGLQVENSGTVTKVCCGVDASLDFLQAAKDQGADLCIVHHGLSWGTSLARITGTNYRLVSFLIENDIALYASHLPLDAHPSLGNNACIAAALGLAGVSGFGMYHGNLIGCKGSLPAAIPFAELCDRVRSFAPGGNFHALPFGKNAVRTVGVVSGGGSDEIGQAVDAGLDCFLTGEVNLQAYHAAKHGGINMIAAGHYATEVFGVKALGGFLSANFKLPFEFVNFQLPW